MDPSVNPIQQSGHVPPTAPTPPVRHDQRPIAQPHSEREAAARLIEQQAERIYQQDPPHQSANAAPDPYNRTHQQLYDWQRYHTAWQQYYQQYYARYYESQQHAQQSVAKTNEPGLPAAESLVTDSHQPAALARVDSLKNDLRSKVVERARALQQGRYFVPVTCVLIVLLLLLFLQFNRLLVAQVETYISPSSSTHDAVVVDPADNSAVGNDPKLIIPKVNVNVPVNYNVATVDERIIQGALERGVVHYNLPGASSVPGQQGNAVILGHSSNDVFDPGDYKFAFLLIDRLQPGDLFYMNYQGRRYAYQVSQKKIIKPTDWRVLQQDSDKPTVVLVTGTPAGTATNRLLVYGEQISPDPRTASTKPTNHENSNPSAIPGNSPTFFERLGDLLF